MNKAVLIDLDGTIIETKTGSKFPIDKNDWMFTTNILTSLENVFRNHYKICIITNQGGISEGYVDEADFIEKIETIIEKIESSTVIPKGYIKYFYCKEFDATNFHRKPNPGMAYECALEFEINLSESVMVGDMASDKEFAINSGIGVFVWAEDFVIEGLIK